MKSICFESKTLNKQVDGSFNILTHQYVKGEVSKGKRLEGASTQEVELQLSPLTSVILSLTNVIIVVRNESSAFAPSPLTYKCCRRPKMRYHFVPLQQLIRRGLSNPASRRIAVNDRSQKKI